MDDRIPSRRNDPVVVNAWWLAGRMAGRM